MATGIKKAVVNDLPSFLYDFFIRDEFRFELNLIFFLFLLLFFFRATIG